MICFVSLCVPVPFSLVCIAVVRNYDGFAWDCCLKLGSNQVNRYCDNIF